MLKLSTHIQNDIIRYLATYIRNSILSEIYAAEIYSFIKDETIDVSHTEQVSMCILYVFDNHNETRHSHLPVNFRTMAAKPEACQLLQDLC